MKHKKKIPAIRSGIEVRYAYDGVKKHKLITVSLIRLNRKNEILMRNTVKDLHPNAKKKALDAAITLNVMSGSINELVIDENLMRDEYLAINDSPIIIKEAE